MTGGGKRDGAGRKPRHVRYDKRNPLMGKRAFLIGLRCEVLWRESYEHNIAGFHWVGDRRPRSRKRIKRQVVGEFGETPRMVEQLWKDYRRFEADDA